VDKKEYERLQFRLLFFEKTDVVCESDFFVEEDWRDDNADNDGWT
jgi:hypothetical protein